MAPRDEFTPAIRDLQRVGDVLRARLVASAGDIDLGALTVRLTLGRSEITAERVADAIVRAAEAGPR